MRIDIRKAESADILHVANHLRSADMAELSASMPPGIPPRFSVMESALCSVWCMAVRVDDRPAILFGLAASDHPRAGVPWLVGTDDMFRIGRPFVRGCREWVRQMRARFPFLYNQVHAANVVSINWLRWLGFHVDDAPTGPGGEFRYFWIGDPDHV